jgi:hypothetical protein
MQNGPRLDPARRAAELRQRALGLGGRRLGGVALAHALVRAAIMPRGPALHLKENTRFRG